MCKAARVKSKFCFCLHKIAFAWLLSESIRNVEKRILQNNGYFWCYILFLLSYCVVVLILLSIFLNLVCYIIRWAQLPQRQETVKIIATKKTSALSGLQVTLEFAGGKIVCSRLSNSGDERKIGASEEKKRGRRGGVKEPLSPLVFFSSLAPIFRSLPYLRAWNRLGAKGQTVCFFQKLILVLFWMTSRASSSAITHDIYLISHIAWQAIHYR